MLKLTEEELLDELTAELAGYEEISNDKIDDFIGNVKEYIYKQKGKNKKIQEKSGAIVISLEDESTIFNMVDTYLVAVIDNETDKYWSNWKL